MKNKNSSIIHNSSFIIHLVRAAILACLVLVLTSGTADAAIAQRGSVTSADQSGTTVSVTMPTGVVNGDLMFAFVCFDDTTAGGVALDATITGVPTGWSPLLTRQNIGVVCYLYQKTAGVSEAGPYTWTWDQSADASNYGKGAIIAYSGGLYETGGGSNFAVSTSHTLTGITTSNANDLLIGFYGNDASSTYSSFTSPLTLVTNTGNAGMYVGIASGTQVSAGASGNLTGTQGISDDGNGFLIALKSNTAPTISAVSVGYVSYSRTGVNNATWNLDFTPFDTEQTGANALTYYVHTGPSRTGTQVATGTSTSSINPFPGIAYNASGMVAGTNTLYLSVYDGALYSGTNPSFTVLRDDDNPSATSISHSPNPVTGTKQYTTTFTANDTTSRGTSELRWWVRTATGGGGTQLASGNLTWSGNPTTTGTITDSALVNGANTRYVRVCDGANNCTDNSFTVTASIVPPTVTTSPVSGLTVTAAILNGSANPNGKAATGWFRYYTSSPGTCSDSGGTRAPTSGGTSLGSGSTGVAYSESITGLTSGTTYYSCAFASNSDGTGVGTVVSFVPAGGGTCSSVPTSGSYTMSSSCVFGAGTSTYDGVDLDPGSNTTTNTGVITIQAGRAMTVGANQTIAYGSISKPGASIVKFTGGVLRKGPLWVPDTDGDGYPDSASPANTWSLTQPAGYSRRSVVGNNISLTDCSTNDGDTFQNQTVATDADQDRYATESATVQCAGSSTIVSGITYYRNSSGNFAFIAASGGAILGTSDCDDTSARPCPPTGVSASGASTTQMNVSWSAGTGPAQTSYNLVWCSGTSCTPTTTITGVTSTYAHTGRTCGTTYGYNIIAVNAAGSSTASSNAYGATSSCSGPPIVTTNVASSITATTAILNGIFDSNGGSSPLFWWRYGTTNTGNCSTLTSATSSYSYSGSTAAGQQIITNATTTYYFCAVSSNSLGTTYGGILSFTTLKANGATCTLGSECGSGNCYVDADGDRYAPASGTKTCKANSQLAGTDCFDSNANAHPNQTSYFSTPISETGFDYDCSGTAVVNPAYTYYGGNYTYADPICVDYSVMTIFESTVWSYCSVATTSNIMCGKYSVTGWICAPGTIDVQYYESSCTLSCPSNPDYNQSDSCLATTTTTTVACR